MNLLCNAFYGEGLLRASAEADRLERRSCFGKLSRYLDSTSPRVCVLFGLRRTGKTVMMLQAAREREEKEPGSCVYLSLTPADTMATLRHDLDELLDADVRNVFLDEVTAVPGFVDLSAQLADYFAMSGMRVVLAGTNSLSFLLAEDGPLFDRTVDIATTRMTFAEWNRLLGGGIDDYMRRGGALVPGDVTAEPSPFRDWASASSYIDSAIVDNMVSSLLSTTSWGMHRQLGLLASRGALADAVRKTIQNVLHGPVPKAPQEVFRPADPDGVDIDRLASSIRSALMRSALSNWEDAPAEGQQYADFVERVVTDGLIDMDVVIPLWEEGTAATQCTRFAISQPGMRHAFLAETSPALKKDECFRSPPMGVRESAPDAMEGEAKERLLADIVLADTIDMAGAGRESFGLQRIFGFKSMYTDPATGKAKEYEFDVVVCDADFRSCSLYEVSLSGKVDPRQVKHLTSPEALADVEYKYGRAAERTVLYTGESMDDPLGLGVRYVNVEEYLLNLTQME